MLIFGVLFETLWEQEQVLMKMGWPAGYEK